MLLKVETVGQDRKVPISTYFEMIFLVTIPHGNYWESKCGNLSERFEVSKSVGA